MSNIFQLDDNKLIEKFVQGTNQLLASDRMRLEVTGTVSQLISRNGEPIAIMYLQNQPRNVIVKRSSPFFGLLDPSLQAQGFVLTGEASRAGFVEYKYYVAPAGYQVFYTDPAILWKKWWPTERFQNKRRFNMDILVSFKDNWYPIQDIVVSVGNFRIETITGQLLLKRDGKVLWLAQTLQKNSSDSSLNLQPASGAFSDFQTSQPDFFPVRRSQKEDTSINYSSTQLMAKTQATPAEVGIQPASVTDVQLELAKTEQKCAEWEQRAAIAEQRLEVVYKYLAKIGINPQDIYRLR